MFFRGDKRWEDVSIDFEFEASYFEIQRHCANEYDLIVCWENDWEAVPANIDITFLSEKIKN